jgi:hypothetical protein
MPYSCRVFDSFAAVDIADWNLIRAQCEASVFTDPRFINAVEIGMTPGCEFFYLIVYDRDTPVACAGLTRMTIDLADFTEPRIGWIVRHVPFVFSRFRKLKVLFCSLPGSPGDKSLLLTPSADRSQTMAALDATTNEIALKARTDAVIYKEFSPSDLEDISPLLARGYARIEIPPMHCLSGTFASFRDYCAALRARYRMQITRSAKKLVNSGVQQLVLTRAADILALYTPEVHAMYEYMVLKSDVKVEVLPIEYYREMTRRLEGDLDFIVLKRDSRVIAFGWCVRDHRAYHMMYAGLDYELNNELDLYFNLMYAGLDRAFRSGAAVINVGQTATVFKSRMGCFSEPRYIFAKGLGPFMSRFFRHAAGFLVIKKPSNEPSDIFKKTD